MRTLLTSNCFRFLLFALIPLLPSCNNDAPANQKPALPHNLEQNAQLSKEEAEQLAAAKGKTATLISSPDLLNMIRQDTSALLVVNFWKTDCQPCLKLQQHFQAIQQQVGENKLNILTISLDEEEDLDKINLELRQAGITSGTFLLKKENPNWFNSFSANWDGTLPAFLTRTADGYEQFYQQEFSENELKALLQPFLLSFINSKLNHSLTQNS